MKKRVLCLILAVLMLLSLFPASALAEEAALTDEPVGDGVLDVPSEDYEEPPLAPVEADVPDTPEIAGEAPGEDVGEAISLPQESEPVAEPPLDPVGADVDPQGLQPDVPEVTEEPAPDPVGADAPASRRPSKT